MSKAVVSVENVSKAFNLYERPRDMLLEAVLGGQRHDVFWALRDISFEISEGERVGFVGPNGAGKSTLLRLITGNLQPTGGRVTVDGKVSALLSLTSFLDPERTGIENIRFNLVMNGVEKRRIASLIEEIVDFTELGAFIHAPVRTYSSGMGARLSFAISTSITPDILIVDEVLGAGDAYFAVKATLRMVELCKEGRALLFVSHAPSAVQMLCNRAIWLDGGSIRGMGAVGEILRAYEADFRRQEDESTRTGNAERRDERLAKLLPGEVSRTDLARVRLTGPANRITDTHYVRRIQLDMNDRPEEVALTYGDPNDPGVRAGLDIVRSEWGRLHTRKGAETRTLQPSSHPLRGGHVLIRRPAQGNSSDQFRLTVESTSLGQHEQLKAQLADPDAGAWTDLALESRTRIDANWERAVFSGTVDATDAGRHQALLASIIEESRPDIEIVGARMLADGRETTRVRERMPFAIEVTVRANRLVPTADVSLKVLRIDGTYVFWQSSGQAGANLSNVEGVKLVTFAFEPNILGAGEYELTVELQNGFDIESNWPYSQVYDRRVGILAFTIDREWSLLMLGPVNYVFPVEVTDAPSRADSAVALDGG